MNIFFRVLIFIIILALNLFFTPVYSFIIIELISFSFINSLFFKDKKIIFNKDIFLFQAVTVLFWNRLSSFNPIYFSNLLSKTVFLKEQGQAINFTSYYSILKPFYYFLIPIIFIIIFFSKDKLLKCYSLFLTIYCIFLSNIFQINFIQESFIPVFFIWIWENFCSSFLISICIIVLFFILFLKKDQAYKFVWYLLVLNFIIKLLLFFS